MITTKEIQYAIDEALARFGTYQFTDRGPGEVMDIGKIEDAMKDMTGAQISDVLAEIRQSGEYGEMFVCFMMSYMDDRGNIEEVYTDPRLKGLN